jgi:hypothetical protein
MPRQPRFRPKSLVALWLCVRTHFFCCRRLRSIRNVRSGETKPMGRVSSLKCQVFSPRDAECAKQSQSGEFQV